MDQLSCGSDYHRLVRSLVASLRVYVCTLVPFVGIPLSSSRSIEFWNYFKVINPILRRCSILHQCQSRTRAGHPQVSFQQGHLPRRQYEVDVRNLDTKRGQMNYISNKYFYSSSEHGLGTGYLTRHPLPVIRQAIHVGLLWALPRLGSHPSVQTIRSPRHRHT